MRLRRLGLIFALTLTLGSVSPVIPAEAGTGYITGQLVDGDSGNNAPAVGVTVQACSGGSCVGTPVVSDSNGNYTLTSVPTGTWTVLTLPPTPCGPTDFARAQASNVSVSDTQTTTAPTIILTRAKGGIRGRTYDAALGPLHPIMGVAVFADNAEQGGNGYQGATTDANGYFELDCLPAQRGYFVTAGPPPPFVNQADSLFAVTAGQSLYHDMALSQGTSSMHGHVTCGGVVCSPPAGILVLQFCGAGGTGASNPCALSSLSTDTSGNFQTPTNSLLPGNYTVHVFAPPGWDNGAYFNIPVLSGENHAMPNMNLIQSTPQASGRLIGTVTDAAGAHYANCRMNTFDQMTATPPTGQGFLTGVPTDVNGFYDSGYSLTPDTNGQFRVWLDCPGHDEVTTNVDSLSQRITLGPSWIRQVNFFWPEPPRPYTGGDTAVGVAQPGTDAYFAEGFTGLSAGLAFHEYLTVQNPNNFSEELTVDYLLASGSVITKTYTLGQLSRTTINVNADVGPNQNVSAHLHTAPAAVGAPPNTFVAERPIYFDYPGGITGGTDGVGAQTLSNTYYFAEGTTNPGFNEYLTVMNPNSSAIMVDITYYYSDGSTPLTITRTIGATTRATYYVNGTLDGVGPGKSVSAQVSTAAHGGQLFLAERPMYFNALGVTGGSDAVGASALDSTGNLAEGNTFAFNKEYLTVLSAGTTPCVSLATTYLYGDGTPNKTLTQTLTANARTTFYVNDSGQAGGGHPVSVHLSCAMPSTGGTFLAERPMYFSLFGDDGGSDAIAVPDSALSQTVYFAEGYTGFNEFLTVLNTNSSDINTHVTYYFPDGTTKLVAHTFPANARTTINVNTEVGVGTPVSASIDSGSATLKILAERPMYFAY